MSVDYAEVLARIEQELAERSDESIIDPGLNKITELLDVMGNPQNAYASIHIAGTNGKTTISRMIGALLQQFSLRTGRTTSPHLHSVTERISIDEEAITPQQYCELYAEIKPYVELIDQKYPHSKLSKFEILTAMAFMAFADAPIDVGIIEVGLGGRLDATNVINATVAVITPISVDHQHYLGDTLSDIAREKAGIIKKLAAGDGLVQQDQIVIMGSQESEARAEIIAATQHKDAIVARFGQEFQPLNRAVAVGGQVITLQGLSGVYEDIFLPLHGAHQAENAAVALAAVEAFFGAGPGRMLDADAVMAGFAQVASPGRLERVAANPTVLIDAAHNPHGARTLAKALQEDFHFDYTVAVVGILADKDARGIIQPLAEVCNEIIVTSSHSARSMPLEQLYEVALGLAGADRVHTAASVDLAIAQAVDVVNKNIAAHPGSGVKSGGGVIVCGSVITAGQARQALHVELSEAKND